MRSGVLVVCTGNICRSPYAALLLADRLRRVGVEAEIASAGSRAVLGSGMDRPMARRLASRGVLNAHRARQLVPQLADSADLVLTADRGHRDHVESISPTAASHTFTLTEFARVATAITSRRLAPAPSLPALIERSVSERASVGPALEAENDDLPDPYRRSEEIADEVAARIDLAVEQIVGALVRGGGR